jgi:hypothetical protein
MSASSPFRSHLLQQWTKGGRSPIGVATWLKKAIDDDTEEDNNPRPQKQNSNLYRSTLSSSKDSSQLTSIAAPAAATSWSTSVASDNNDDCNRKLKINHNITTINDYNNSDDDEGKNNLLLGSLKVDRNYSTRNLYSDAIHNMMIPRGGATAASKDAANDDERRRELLKTAIDRAVRVAQKKCSSQNHGEVVPFAFRRFFSNSQSSERLAEICSRNKIEEKWSNHNDNVQAFIVALVHNNQRATNDEELNDNDPFEAMEYSPPETEQNLEDVSSCISSTCI